MKQIFLLTLSIIVLNSCSIYRNYSRPENLPTDSLYRDMTCNGHSNDTLSLGDLPWQAIFKDSILQELIRYGLANNTDMQVALLRVEQAQAQLKAARLAFLPSLTLSPNGTLSHQADNGTSKTYELPVQASWEVDLFGNLRNAKKETQASLLQQEAYKQVVQSELIATIANDYYT